MTHLYIEQSGITEEVSSSVISKLYELASSGTLDGTSDLKGRLHTNAAKEKHVTYLNNNFDDLYISADIQYISFDDPDMETCMKRYIGTNDGVSMQDIQTFVVSNASFGAAYANTHGGGNRPLFMTESERNSIDSFDEISFFNGITTIDGMVFSDSNISSMLLPSSVSILKDWAFSSCLNLTSINLDNIQYLYKGVFYNTGLTGTVNLSNIKQIGSNSGGICFWKCPNITEINCGNNLEQIVGDDNFMECTSLTKVTGLSNITSIPKGTFGFCTNLINVDIDWTKIISIGQMAFRFVPLSGSITLSSLSSIDGNYENGAFRGCTGLTSVDLSGSTITSLSGTFRDCTNLSSVTLPNTLTSLESNTFNGCSSLQTIDLKNVTYLQEYEFRTSGLTSIDLSNIRHIGGIDMFSGCTNLTTVTFPSTPFNWFDDNYNTSYQNKRSFLRQCTSLTSVDLSNALSLGISMFYNDTSLTTVTLSASNITTIPEEFCQGCTKLSSLGEKIKPTTIGDRAFQDCNSLNSNTYLDLSEVTYIGNSALKGTTITGSVNLPECLELGESPFHENSGITELHCPKLTTINRYTIWQNFANLEVLDLPVTDRLNSVQNNPKLTTINAPLATKFSTYDDGKLYLANNPMLSILNIDFSLVTKIGDWCFDKDAGLNGQYLEFPNVTEIGAQAFGSNAINFVLSKNVMVTYSDYGAPFTNYTGTVYVPDALLSTYRADSIWSQLPSSQMKGLSELPQS